MSNKPTPLAVIADAIPAVLRELPQWVVWRYVEEGIDPQTGEIDYDKPPLCARGGAASSTNPATWATFGDALSAYRGKKLDGIGFVLRTKPGADGPVLIGVDLDHCCNPQTGEIESWASEIIAQLASYAEVSPSGAGIRIFVLGKLPPHGRKRGHFECYSTARYVTVTGQRITGTPATIERREAELLAVHKRHFPEHHESKQRCSDPAPVMDLTDLDLIEKAKKAKNGERFSALWNGDTGGFSSQSEADLALCSLLAFWCGANSSERIDGLFRQSGLFRAKWNRADYRERTIGKALGERSEFYSPRRATPRNSALKAGSGSLPPAAPSMPQAARREDEPHLTDLGNAQRVVQRHGADLRFAHEWKTFLVWDGQRWATDSTGEAVRRVKATQAFLFRSVSERLAALNDAHDDDARKSLAAQLLKQLKHALAWEDARAIRRSLDLVQSEPGIPVQPTALDRNPLLLNVQNGTIDLGTGKLREHRREDLATKIAHVAYDPNASCPLWQRCLLDWMAGNVNLTSYLQRVVGYSLSADVSEQVLFFLYGTGANGKSTFLSTIRELLGDYGCQAVSELLMAKNTEAHPTERADLFGRRFVCTIETDEGRRLAEALMKQLTGGDSVKARRMRQDFFEMRPTWKIFLAANHKPVIRGTDFAVWRRIRLVPFTAVIRERDKTLLEKLRSELPGILNWALTGFREWQVRGLDDPAEIQQATTAYQREMDMLGNFFDECCMIADFAKVKSSVLLKAFHDWTGDRAMSAQTFRKRLNERGFYSSQTGGSFFYHGVGLASPATETEDESAEFKSPWG